MVIPDAIPPACRVSLGDLQRFGIAVVRNHESRAEPRCNGGRMPTQTYCRVDVNSGWLDCQILQALAEHDRNMHTWALSETFLLGRVELLFQPLAKSAIPLFVFLHAVNIDATKEAVHSHFLVLNFQLAPQFRWQRYPALAVQLALGPIVIRDESERFSGPRIFRRQLRQKLFVLFPDRNRVNSSCAAINASHKQFLVSHAAQILLEVDRKLEPPLIIDVCCEESPRGIH